MWGPLVREFAGQAGQQGVATLLYLGYNYLEHMLRDGEDPEYAAAENPDMLYLEDFPANDRQVVGPGFDMNQVVPVRYRNSQAARRPGNFLKGLAKNLKDLKFDVNFNATPMPPEPRIQAVPPSTSSTSNYTYNTYYNTSCDDEPRYRTRRGITYSPRSIKKSHRYTRRDRSRYYSRYYRPKPIIIKPRSMPLARVPVKHYSQCGYGSNLMGTTGGYWTPVVSMTTAIAKGSNDYERIGNTIFLKSFLLNWHFKITTYDVVGSSIRFRLILFRWFKDTSPTTGEILQDSTDSKGFITSYNSDHNQFYHILYDRKYTFTDQITKPSIGGRFWRSFPSGTMAKWDNAGASTGHIYYLVWYESGSVNDVAYFGSNNKLHFTD